MTTKIAMYQMPHIGSLEKNFAETLHGIQRAADEGAKLVLFPEMHLTEFFPQYPKGRDFDAAKYALTCDSEIIRAMQICCKYCHIAAVPNIYLAEDGVCYDASLFIDEFGEILAVQKMVHVVNAEKFYEADYYAPSNTGFQTFDTSLGRLGIVVCFDRHFPESILLEMAQGANLILIPTVNTKEEPLEMFQKEIEVQAYQNSVAIAMCTRVGEEGAMAFAGESVIVDAKGNVLAKGGDEKELIVAELDIEASERIRMNNPYFKCRQKNSQAEQRG